jgi:hypothetical protein
MTPLDYDMFRKITGLMGVTPDFFEVCLMVRSPLVSLLVLSNHRSTGRRRYKGLQRFHDPSRQLLPEGSDDYGSMWRDSDSQQKVLLGDGHPSV